MLTNSTDPVSHNVAYERIKYFVYNCLDSVIFVNQNHVDICQIFLSAGLKVSTLPGEPVDQLIGLMLYYKLNAIMEDRIIVEETEISSMLGENMIYLHGANETTDVGEIPKWWNSNEPCYSDFVTLEVDKIVPIQSSSQWRELDLEWQETDAQQETGNIVVFADFKPAHETK